MIHETGPITAVIFDFHQTLIDPGDMETWIHAAASQLGRPLPGEDLAKAQDRLLPIWEVVRQVDPRSARDQSRGDHRAIMGNLLVELVDDKEFADALYTTMTAPWRAYADAAPTLRELRSLGVRTAVLSNTGVDTRPVLERENLIDLIDVVVQSYELGVVKPDPAIFEHALTALDSPAATTLMVGDHARDDAAAAYLGIRCVILPRTAGPIHGLRLATAIVNASLESEREGR